MVTTKVQQDRDKGNRAEEVADWYFRLNGFLSIPGFIVHPEQPEPHARTEADLMAVRFPRSVEKLNGFPMRDHISLTNLAGSGQVLFILVEVKAGLCRVNGPWSNKAERNMHRAVERLGFASGEEIDEIASAMYRDLRWEDNDHVLQYVSVGARANSGLQAKYPKLAQITWEEIGRFLYYRFKEFPQKVNRGKPVHQQWPRFGRAYGEYSRTSQKKDSVDAIGRYIETGSLILGSLF